MIDELDDATNASQPLQQGDFAVISPDDPLVQALEGNAFEGKKLPVFGRDTVDLTGPAAAKSVDSCVRFAIDAKEKLLLLVGLQSGGGTGSRSGCLGNRHFRWRRWSGSLSSVVGPRGQNVVARSGMDEVIWDG